MPVESCGRDANGPRAAIPTVQKYGIVLTVSSGEISTDPKTPRPLPLSRVLKGSGECAEQGWVFLGLAIPAWTFVFFIAMIVAAIALSRRD